MAVRKLRLDDPPCLPRGLIALSTLRPFDVQEKTRPAPFEPKEGKHGLRPDTAAPLPGRADGRLPKWRIHLQPSG